MNVTRTDRVLQPVILCGGAGTRLWPLSRESHPKQFLSLGASGTMLQQTVTRLSGLEAYLPVAVAPIVVCNAEHRFTTAQQLAEIGARDPSILLEPQGRNTAPALTLAALQASAGGADPVLLAMPADHVIAAPDRFIDAIVRGFDSACAGAMITFGVEPDRPETGYGYIRFAAQPADHGVHAVLSFTEKPDAQIAAQYLECGDYFWNSGIFMVGAQVWLDAMAKCRPDILRVCVTAMEGAVRDLDFIRPDASWFEQCPADSIDYAVMERVPRHPEFGIAARMVAMQAGWSDLGSWDALWESLPRDGDDNAVLGDCVLLESSNTLVHSTGRLVAAVGLQGMVVVETPDAVLVVDKARTQEVKRIVTQLKEAGRALADCHRKVDRPWGWYDSIDCGARFQVKRIVVNPGARLSLQMHHHRAEHWVVVSGTAEVTNGDKVFLMSENESTFIPLGHVHRLANPGTLPLEIIEVQSGSYLGEDDIVRFEDTYGRVGESEPSGS